MKRYSAEWLAGVALDAAAKAGAAAQRGYYDTVSRYNHLKEFAMKRALKAARREGYREGWDEGYTEWLGWRGRYGL